MENWLWPLEHRLDQPKIIGVFVNEPRTPLTLHLRHAVRLALVSFAHTRQNKLMIVIVSLAIVLFWVAPIGSSLWLDEAGTVWAIRGTLSETVMRAFEPGQPSV